jgi:hypothetical protein
MQIQRNYRLFAVHPQCSTPQLISKVKMMNDIHIHDTEIGVYVAKEPTKENL